MTRQEAAELLQALSVLFRGEMFFGRDPSSGQKKAAREKAICILTGEKWIDDCPNGERE